MGVKEKAPDIRLKEVEEMRDYIRKHWEEYNEAPKTTIKFYRVGKSLGKGAFGTVNLALHKLTGKFVAIKSIRKVLIESEKLKTKIAKEVFIWEGLSHPGVIRFFTPHKSRLYETFESEKNFFFAEELCAGGDLLTYVRKRRKVTESVAKFVLRQILEGLHYCHVKGVLHRDIKLDNVLIKSDSTVKVVALLTARSATSESAKLSSRENS